MLFYAALVFYVFAEGDPVGISKRDLVLEKKTKITGLSGGCCYCYYYDHYQQEAKLSLG